MNTVKEGLLFVTDFKQDLSQHMDIYWIDHLLNHKQSLQITSDKYAWHYILTEYQLKLIIYLLRQELYSQTCYSIMLPLK